MSAAAGVFRQLARRRLAASELARRIAVAETPKETCALLVEYAKVQPRGEGDDPVLLASLRTLDEVRADRSPVEVLSARRARPYGWWLWATEQVERLTAWRAGGAL